MLAKRSPIGFGYDKKDTNNIRTLPVDHEVIRENIDFMLSHFKTQHELFPRAILLGEQKKWVIIKYDSQGINCKDQIFEYSRQYDFVDCRINAFPYNTQHSIDFEVKNMTSASFIMLDLDSEYFETRKHLDEQLIKIMKKLSQKFNGDANPTVLWTGNGYHIYQPLDGIIFEKEQIFYDFLPFSNGKDLTTEFMRFAEKFFSWGKADPKHRPSINNCLLRLPGTLNSKNGKTVKIIKRWDGNLPNIRYLASDFFDYLIDKRNEHMKQMKIDKRKKLKFNHSNSNETNHFPTKNIEWNERLLEIPLEDYRKYCMWRILCPYLSNVRILSAVETTIILDKWLEKCDNLRKTDFNHRLIIKNDLRAVKAYFPTSKDKLKKDLLELYSIMKAKNIFRQFHLYNRNSTSIFVL